MGEVSSIFQRLWLRNLDESVKIGKQAYRIEILWVILGAAALIARLLLNRQLARYFYSLTLQ